MELASLFLFWSFTTQLTIFNHVKTIFNLHVLNQCKAADKMSCSRTQCSDSAGSESFDPQSNDLPTEPLDSKFKGRKYADLSLCGVGLPSYRQGKSDMALVAQSYQGLLLGHLSFLWIIETPPLDQKFVREDGYQDVYHERYFQKLILSVKFTHNFLTLVLGAQKNRLIGMVLLSTHNICLSWDIYIYPLLSRGPILALF